MPTIGRPVVSTARPKPSWLILVIDGTLHFVPLAEMRDLIASPPDGKRIAAGASALQRTAAELASRAREMAEGAGDELRVRDAGLEAALVWPADPAAA